MLDVIRAVILPVRFLSLLALSMNVDVMSSIVQAGVNDLEETLIGTKHNIGKVFDVGSNEGEGVAKTLTTVASQRRMDTFTNGLLKRYRAFPKGGGVNCVPPYVVCTEPAFADRRAR